MDQREKSMVDILSSNRNVIAKEFKTQNAINVTLAAFEWMLADRQASAEQMRASFNCLKDRASALYAARSRHKLALVSRMAMSDDGEAYLAEVQRIYEKIMEDKLAKTNTRFGTAILIANSTSTPEEADLLLEHTQTIFAGMREAHPTITDEKSMPFATIAALSERDEKRLLVDVEECYALLGKEYGMTEGRQSMASVLAISPLSPEQKVARVRDLRAAFKACRIPIGWASTREFAILAMLALDDRPAKEIAVDVAELDRFIKKRRGFGDFSVDRAIRLLYASVISMNAYQDSMRLDAVANTIASAVAQALVDWFVYIVVVAGII